MHISSQHYTDVQQQIRVSKTTYNASIQHTYRHHHRSDKTTATLVVRNIPNESNTDRYYMIHYIG